MIVLPVAMLVIGLLIRTARKRRMSYSLLKLQKDDPYLRRQENFKPLQNS